MGLTCPSAPVPGHLGSDRAAGHRGFPRQHLALAGRHPSGMGVNLGRAVLNPGPTSAPLTKPGVSVVCLQQVGPCTQRPVLTHDKLSRMRLTSVWGS